MLNIWCVPRHRHCSCSASVGKQNLASITLICSLQLFPFLLLCSILLFEMFAPVVVVVGVVACRLSSFPHPSVSALSSSSSSSSFRRRRALIVFSCLFPRRNNAQNDTVAVQKLFRESQSCKNRICRMSFTNGHNVYKLKRFTLRLIFHRVSSAAPVSTFNIYLYPQTRN